jgi:uncharacterized protein (TIRG00374 family)
VNKKILTSIYHLIKAVLPWVITAVAITAICRDLDWKVFFSHAGEISISWFLCSVAMLLLSYPFRAIRWRAMFPDTPPSYVDSYKALILGFFMNNILPARAGEFVRAHAGGKFFNTTRTTVLATIAGERLVDGLTISLIFLLLATKVQTTGHMYSALMYACTVFGVAGLGVLCTVILKNQIFSLLRKIALGRPNSRIIPYACSRAEQFIDGLSPIFSRSHALPITLWSLLIWGVELASYSFMLLAFHVPLTLEQQAFYMVAYNFSSLIPAAPGGLGVIEAVGSSVLMTIAGLQKETAVAIVLSTHILQYLIVGIPGGIVLLRWKKENKNEPITGETLSTATTK